MTMQGIDPPPSSAPRRGTSRVIGIGAGRGGAGKSLLSINLGIYLAQLGRSVIVADVDPAGSDLHALVGLDVAPVPTREQFENDAIEPVATPVPGLHLLPALYDPTAATLLRASRKARMLGKLRQLGADYILLDLGAGAPQASLDFFIASDAGLCVTTPEPAAIESTYRFLRALFIRRLRRALVGDRFKLRSIERALHELPPLPAPPAVIHALKRIDSALAETAEAELARIRACLVVNQTRVRSDIELGPSMRYIADRYLGIDVDYLGHIDHDDAVWLTVRRRRPLLIDSPTSKSARNIERIARRLLAFVSRDVVPARPARVGEPTLYDTLGVTRGATDEEIRRASRHKRELFAPDSLPLSGIVFGDELSREQTRIAEAHDTLLDPVRRRAYDLSVFPESETSSAPDSERETSAAADELAMMQAELAREITPETQFTGALLRRVRESQGKELQELSNKTKISIAFLQAIEEEEYTLLPALVYTRGFVQEVAKLLGLDPTQVARTYVARMRQILTASGRPQG